MLESYKHAKNAFLTLTYSDDHLPSNENLKPQDLQKFFKRLRRQIEPSTLRYFACGEYGETTQRPHYHAALFGLGPEDAETIDKSWGLGHSFTGDLTSDSATYVAGYVTKKMTNPNNPMHEYLLSGRYPEFARMSLNPGIGATAVSDIADTLNTPSGCDALAEIGDVPHALLLGKKSIPLGKYIRGKLREKIGFPNSKTPDISLDNWKEEMRKLYEDHKATKTESAFSRYVDKTEHFKQYLIEKNAQKVLQLETRSKIFTAKKDKL